MTIAASVMNVLEESQAEYQAVAHPRSFSSVETAMAAHVPEDHIAKGVLLKDAQGYLLVVIPASQWVDYKRLEDEFDRDLELATEDEIRRFFDDCALGAIPPLGRIYGVETVLDESLTSLAYVYFEGGDHERLVKVSADGFKTLMAGVHRGHFSNAT